MITSKNFILYLLLAVVPAIFINQLLIKIIHPRRSFKHFLLYIVALLAAAFLYTLLLTWILLRFVWPLKQ